MSSTATPDNVNNDEHNEDTIPAHNEFRPLLISNNIYTSHNNAVPTRAQKAALDDASRCKSITLSKPQPTITSTLQPTTPSSEPNNSSSTRGFNYLKIPQQQLLDPFIQQRIHEIKQRPNIKLYVNQCLLCARYNIPRQTPPGLLETPEPPSGIFDLIGIDFWGPTLEATSNGQHRTTKYAPYELLYGKHPTLPFSQPQPMLQFIRSNDYYNQFRKYRSFMIQQVRTNIQQQQQLSKKRYDQHRQHIQYEIGQLVLVKPAVRNNKMQAIFEGPYRVTNVLAPVTYEIQLEHSNYIRQLHVNVMKPIFTPQD
ncbi:unnamed protein product [Rotaria sp. Silwood2]|nr:unnamed protein product [Rotaria sp. Silwood2]CAF3123286.1 unnamed protein product [Rotaria sp. Silwood2]CAF3329308.1 unnamed protein product [Rotaria sp. Silwood2]CAF4083198.1 unnamed protein product [Rotaria sp. Silwood2]CAF4218479.1 unnamed protein product [Rotaria sp. Silwood2]